MKTVLLSEVNMIRLSEMDRPERCFAVMSLLLTFKYDKLNWPDSAINKIPDNTANRKKDDFKGKTMQLYPPRTNSARLAMPPRTSTL